jgi:hypothetical protein
MADHFEKSPTGKGLNVPSEQEHSRKGVPEMVFPISPLEMLVSRLESKGKRWTVDDVLTQANRRLIDTVERVRVSIEDPKDSKGRPDKVNNRFRQALGDEFVGDALARVRQFEVDHPSTRALEKPEYSWKGERPAKSIEALLALDLWDAGWFAPYEESFVTKASRFDDYFMGTDMIVEFFPPEEKREEKWNFIGAIDVTINKDIRILRKKWNQVQNLVREHHLGGFQFYISPRTNKVEPHVRGVPHIVLYIPEDIAKELVALSQLAEETSGTFEEKEFMERIKNHPFRDVFRAQIYQFLVRMGQYVEYVKRQEGDKDQLGNIEAINALLRRLKALGYPEKISDPDIRELCEDAFRF